MVVLHLGALSHDQELILVALAIGMAACGTVLLSALPRAAFIYMSGILIPSALKCVVLNQKGYFLLGALAVSSWGFLAALIAKIARDIAERQIAALALAERDVQLALAGKSPSSEASHMMLTRRECSFRGLCGHPRPARGNCRNTAQ